MAEAALGEGEDFAGVEAFVPIVAASLQDHVRVSLQEAWAAAFASGEALSLEQAIVEALPTV